ncbi:MAG: exodeoxyribonuclease VII large subunit [Opitutaceae bacterium]|nr:exodeoxyribonuclease VII large subunit [Opitutaceae bacterium]
MLNPNQDLLIPPAQEIESVSEFNQRVKYLLEREIGGAWVRGEISNLRHQSSGHIYFSLKDAGGQVSAVLFRNDAVKQDVEIEDGMRVVVFGQASVYEPRGNYQLIVRLVVMDGLGRLQQQFERLKARLAEEGLFDDESKLSIPEFPRTIGVVTSPQGAAVQDFIRILKRREWVGYLLVLPTKVQGEGAAAEIAETIDYAQKLSGLELLVVCRGGGSVEDLWSFNEELVARAIHRSAIPVISAVGHEIDFTLSDFVADLRAETPSTAAEIISSRYLELVKRFEVLSVNLPYWVREGLDTRSSALEQLNHRLQVHSPFSRVESAQQRLDDLAGRLCSLMDKGFFERHHQLSSRMLSILKLDPFNKILNFKEKIHMAGHLLDTGMNSEFADKRNRLFRAESILRSLSPKSVLNRGFAIVRDEVGRPITSKESIQSGDKVTAEFKDGEVPLLGE